MTYCDKSILAPQCGNIATCDLCYPKVGITTIHPTENIESILQDERYRVYSELEKWGGKYTGKEFADILRKFLN